MALAIIVCYLWIGVGGPATEPKEQKPALAAEVPDGVTVLVLPNETFILESAGTEKKPRLRLIQENIKLEGQRFFLGDGKVAIEVEATGQGMHFVNTTRKGGGYISGSFELTKGGTFEVGTDYLTLDQLKPGTVYVIAPALGLRYEKKPRK